MLRSLLPRTSSNPKPHTPSSSKPFRSRKSILSLSPLSSSPFTKTAHTSPDPQSQSIFFAKLPPEIRILVYEMVFGEEVVHLTLSGKGRLGHLVCEGGGWGEGSWDCSCRVLVGGGRGCKKLGKWILGILGCCWRGYIEALPILYKAYTFSLLHPTHLLYLPTRLPPPNLQNIHTLRLRWTIRALPYFRHPSTSKLAYPEDTLNWQRGWRILASMIGLKELYVVIADSRGSGEGRWREVEGRLLEDVREVEGPRWFEVWLPYRGCGVEWVLGRSRCVLRRPGGGGEERGEDT